MKCCTKLETAKKRCPIVFQGHPSNFKVTRDKTSPILTQIGRFRTIGRSQLSNPSDLPCFFFWVLLNSNCYACDPFNSPSAFWWCCCPRWKNSFLHQEDVAINGILYRAEEIPIAQQIPWGEPDSKSIFLHFEICENSQVVTVSKFIKSWT